MSKVMYAKNIRDNHRIGRAKRARGEYKDKKAEYGKIIENIIQSGCHDRRQDGRQCPQCKKKYISYDIVRNISENETFARHRIMGDALHWPSMCINCKKIYRKKEKANADPAVVFDTNLGSTLARHMNGTRKDIMERLAFIRNRDYNMCRGCNIPVISAAKSGWKQESINDMYPNMIEPDKTTLIHNIAISCLACNMAQNKLSWDEYLEAMRTIGNVNHTKNTTPLTTAEHKWLVYKHDDDPFKRCPPKVKLELFMKYGRHCAVSSVEMIFKSGYWNTVSYDRFDSKLPYTLENTRLVCKHINFVKIKNITESELQGWLSHIRVQFAAPDNFFDAAYDAYFKKRRKIED